ncbi:MAG: alkaline phosphatase family protein [Chitinophagales bacterium]|nr:alkaline phosphatase family protein [Chitinophagales bacterium]
MKKIVFSIVLSLFLSHIFAQTKQTTSPLNARPKLVVGIVIDQMRWDFLYRYYDRYSNGGFKRLMQEGFNCENTMIPYSPTVTAAGHASIYTGSTPALHGIAGNDWYDYDAQKNMYCTEDKSVKTVGATTKSGEMSPKNLLATTIGDELKLATNFKSKVIGVSLKDRGSILPAGHSADAAYWYDKKTGNFISSTYYMEELPKWASAFNASNAVFNYYQKNWNTLYPINTYAQSDVDTNSYEYEGFDSTRKGFPYNLTSLIDKKDYDVIFSTPYGNSITFDFAKQALINEQLGKDSITDLLAVSLSSTDYIGHAFGPNSIETEDAYLRLDKDIESFLSFLDKEIGKNKYTLFLTADHGVAHIPAYLKKHKIPAGNVSGSKLRKELNVLLKEKFGYDSIILASFKNQFYLNFQLIKQKDLNRDKIMETALEYLKYIPGIDRVLDYTDIQESTLAMELKEQFIKGYHPKRCGDILTIYKPGYIDQKDGGTGTQHASWNPYDAHIPLLFFGYGINKGKLFETTHMTDIAPTITSLLHIQMPNACIGKTISSAIKK